MSFLQPSWSKGSIKSIVAGIALIAAFVNPPVEEAIGRDPLPYMLSHYGLTLAGLLIGYSSFRSAKWTLPLGLIPVIVWHLPIPFAFGGAFLYGRILDEVTITVGALLVGSSIKSFTFNFNVLLFILYMVADTALSFLFMFYSYPYTSEAVPFSPYRSQQEFFITGVVMIVLMNAFLGYVAYLFFKRLSIF